MFDKIMDVKFSHSNRNRWNQEFCIRKKMFPRQICLIFKKLPWFKSDFWFIYCNMYMLFKSNLFVSNISYDIFSVFGPGVCMSEDLMCVCRTLDYLLEDTLFFGGVYFFLLWFYFWVCVFCTVGFFLAKSCMLTWQPSLLARKITQIGYLA